MSAPTLALAPANIQELQGLLLQLGATPAAKRTPDWAVAVLRLGDPEQAYVHHLDTLFQPRAHQILAEAYELISAFDALQVALDDAETAARDAYAADPDRDGAARIQRYMAAVAAACETFREQYTARWQFSNPHRLETQVKHRRTVRPS